MRNKRWLFGALIVGIAIVALSMINLGDNLVYFYTPKEAVAKAPTLTRSDIRVGGLVKPGTVQKNPNTLALSFILSDLDGHELSVSYTGAPPDMFKESQGVVVEGKINEAGSHIVAKRLFVKHSEEYQKPSDHSKMNTEYLQKSMFKNESVN